MDDVVACRPRAVEVAVAAAGIGPAGWRATRSSAACSRVACVNGTTGSVSPAARRRRAPLGDEPTATRAPAPARPAPGPSSRPRITRVRRREQLGDIDHAEEVDHRRDGQRLVAGHRPSNPADRRRQRSHQREVRAGRTAHQHQLRRIESVLRRMADHPAQRAAAVLDGGRRRRHAGQTIIDVHDREPHRQVGQHVEGDLVPLPVTQPPPWNTTAVGRTPSGRRGT